VGRVDERRFCMNAKRITVASLILLCGILVPTALTQLTEAERARARKVIRAADPSVFQKIPMIKADASPQEKLDAFTEIEIGMRRMKAELANERNVPPEVNEGIRAWESFTPAQRRRLLNGVPADRVFAFTPAFLAAVGLTIVVAKFIYGVGKDYSWWGKKAATFQFRPPTDKELDYIKKIQTGPSEGGSGPRSSAGKVDDLALDY
jgi:hypothetical protein